MKGPPAAVEPGREDQMRPRRVEPGDPRRWQRGRRAQPNCLRHAQIVCVTVRDVDFHLEHPYDAAPDAVFALLSDPEYLRGEVRGDRRARVRGRRLRPHARGWLPNRDDADGAGRYPVVREEVLQAEHRDDPDRRLGRGVGGHSSGNVAGRAEGRPGLGHHDRHHPRRGGGRRFGSLHRRDHQGVGAARRRQTRTFRVRPGEEDDGPRARNSGSAG